MGNFYYNFMLKIQSISRPWGTSDLFTLESYQRYSNILKVSIDTWYLEYPSI